MIGALITTLFFAATPVFANRAASLLGSTRANFWRLAVAVAILGGWAHLFGSGLGGTARTWFVLGGVIGFGAGGLAMFESLPRLGSNLSTLIVQCVSAVAAAIIEWLWLGTRLSGGELAAGAITLTGVTLGMLPGSLPPARSAERFIGLLWAFGSAFAQGLGAVLSRKAFAVASLAHEAVAPGTAAYQRAIGGMAIAAIALAIVTVRRIERATHAARAPRWVVANALTGPVLGVTCYQWALRTTPAGIVQPIVAAAPLLTIPFAVVMEGARPHARYYLGAGLAVIGVAALLVR
jgi:drug/metabolite transporter (DMT)-like permease